MIDVKEKELVSFLYKVKEKAINEGEKQLFSFTKEMKAVDFLDVYTAFDDTKENRIFWSNNTKDFQILGIGSVHEIIRNDGDFKQNQLQWASIQEKASIYNPENVMGTGITALGGMAFDPDHKKGDLWRNFPASQLTIPEYMLVYSDSRYFLTINGFVMDGEIISDVVESISVYEKKLSKSKDSHPQGQKVLHQHIIQSDDWKALVQKAVEEIRCKKAKKIVLAREIRVTLNKTADISNMLRRLLDTQPNSYVFAFDQGDQCFLGATPERLVLVKENKLLSTCLAGTAPRGSTVEEDKRLAGDLLQDDKNLEEHGYVVQMIKESIQDYCEDIRIPDQPVIYPLRNLQHLFTPVTAKIKTDFSIFDLVERLHPTPALGGVPREKALHFIREEEFMDRGWYGAPVGWIDGKQNSEFAVAIRSGLVQDDEVSLFAGCGVMRDSDPDMEYEETKVKFLPMLQVLEDHDESY